MMQPEGGRIELIIGPMFAGKTTELMRRVNRLSYAKLQCFVIKYSRDTRYSSDCVAAHDKRTLTANASVSILADVGDRWRDYDVIAVDEGQFFPDLVRFCTTAADASKIIIVSALDGDYLRKPFGDVGELIPLCESVSKLSAVCMMCHRRAGSFTRRTVKSFEQELIGGADMYIATCRECYSQPMPSPRSSAQSSPASPGRHLVPPAEQPDSANAGAMAAHGTSSTSSARSSTDAATATTTATATTGLLSPEPCVPSTAKRPRAASPPTHDDHHIDGSPMVEPVVRRKLA